MDESEGTPERPSAKGANGDIKGAWRPGGAAPNRSPIPQDRVDKDNERFLGEVVANAIMADKVALLSAEDNDSEGPMNANGAAPVALATW
jgi:hypothetical protein